MSDSKLAFIFFEVGMVLAFVSMILGPFDITEWAIATAVIACFVALGGMYLAFSSWDEPDEPVPPAREESDEPQITQEHTV